MKRGTVYRDDEEHRRLRARLILVGTTVSQEQREQIKRFLRSS